MKKIILLLIISCSYLYAYTQNLSLTYNSHPIPNDTVININGDTAATMYVYANCINNFTDSLPVKVKKFEINKIFGSENSFCWDNCYLPNVFVSPSAIFIHAGATCTNFSGEYKPKGNEGTTTVRYTFFNDNNPNDSVCIVVNYNALVSGIQNDVPFKPEVMHASPNPANSFTSIAYSLPDGKDSRLVIRDMLGNEVFSQQLDPATASIRISTADFPDGVYFYTVYLDKRTVVSRKLIVRH